MQLSKKSFLIAFPLIVFTATQPMENNNDKNNTIKLKNISYAVIDINNQSTESNNNNSTSNSSQWWCLPCNRAQESGEDTYLLNNNNNNSNQETIRCKLLRSLFDRCTKKESDLEEGFSESDEDNNQATTEHAIQPHNNRWDREKLKIMGANAIEIAFKTGLAYFSSWTSGPENESTFFALHHASEAMGRHIKFETHRLPKYIAASALALGIGYGLYEFNEHYLEGFDTSARVLSMLLFYKIMNNCFNQFSKPEHKEQ